VAGPPVVVVEEVVVMINPEFENKNFTSNDTFTNDLSPSRILELIRTCFDLSQVHYFFDTESFSKFFNREQKIRIELSDREIQKLKKLGIRIITQANFYRAKALRIVNCRSEVKPHTKEHTEIAELFKQNIEEFESKVLVFKRIDNKYLIVQYPSRFTDSYRVYKLYRKAKEILKRAFEKYRNALMFTLTLPRIFPLAIEVYCCGALYGVIPLQDVILTKLKQGFMKRLRKWWKNTKLETFTAYEFHDDYAEHQHILIFGIPFMIDWNRKFGKKKLDALTYFRLKYGITLSEDSPRTLLSKHVITAVLDEILERILDTIDNLLYTDFLEGYRLYKSLFNISGPVNEVHRIKNGNWEGDPPPDSVTFTKVLSPAKYVVKYLLKVLNMVKNKEEIPPEHQAKFFGYWLLGKRFNSYSPSLGPPNEKEIPLENEETKWEFIGIFEEDTIPIEIIQNQVDS
jgi:hypothetical protein